MTPLIIQSNCLLLSVVVRASSVAMDQGEQADSQHRILHGQVRLFYHFYR